jgi:hypothetical protein
LYKADALIQAYLHIDPEELADEEWGLKTIMAAWVENRKIGKIAGLFSSK